MARIRFGATLAALAVASLMTTTGSANAQTSGRRDNPLRDFLLSQSGAFIGVSVRDVTADEHQRLRLGENAGAYVESVEPRTPAARAGFRTADVVVEFDGERVRSSRHFTRLVEETAVNRSVKAVIVRDGSRQTLEVTPEGRQFGATRRLGPELRGDLRAFPDDRFFRDPLPRLRPQGGLGTVLMPLNEQLAAYFGVKAGVLVGSVDPDSPAAKAGIKAGDVITSVNGRQVNDAGDVRDAVRQAGRATLDVTIVRDRQMQTIAVPEVN